MKTVGIIGNFDVPTYMVVMAAKDAGWESQLIVRTDEASTDDIFMIEKWCGIRGTAPIEYSYGIDKHQSTYTDLTDMSVWSGLLAGFILEEVNTPEFIYSFLSNPEGDFSAFILTGSRKVSCKGSGCYLPSDPFWVRTLKADPDLPMAQWIEGMPLHPWTRWRKNTELSIQTYYRRKPPIEDLTELEVPTFGGVCNCFAACTDTGHFTAIGEMAKWAPMRQDRKAIYKEAQDFLAGI